MTKQPQRPTEVLGALPHRRPNRRSAKREASAPPPDAGRAPGEATANPAPPSSAPGSPRGREIVGTMVQAAAELAEIGLSVSARAIKEAVARLPRP